MNCYFILFLLARIKRHKTIYMYKLKGTKPIRDISIFFQFLKKSQSGSTGGEDAIDGKRRRSLLPWGKSEFCVSN